jgi:uncharacterized protein YbjT (DUF2867 family)
MIITVMGATGHTGHAVATQLLEAGVAVRALGRSAERLAGLAAAGADVRTGDAGDAAYLTEAFSGADAVYTLLPYDPVIAGYRAAQRRIGAAVVAAVRAAGVPKVVFLSSVGADRPSGTGFVLTLHEQEQRLRALAGTDVLILRPGSFFENFEHALPVIEAEGANLDAVAPHVPIPMIASRDIAAAAAHALLELDFEGVEVRELLGPRDLTYTEATRIIGERIGRPGLEYVQIPGEAMAGALVQAGLAPDFAELHVELCHALSSGHVASVQGRTAATTTPTPLEAYAEALAGRALPTA